MSHSVGQREILTQEVLRELGQLCPKDRLVRVVHDRGETLKELQDGRAEAGR